MAKIKTSISQNRNKKERLAQIIAKHNHELEKSQTAKLKALNELKAEKKTRKKVEEELMKTKAIIRNKLKTISEPKGNIGRLELSDIIDTKILQSLMDDFYELTGMLGAILDVSGKVLVAVGWQDICTKFHRCNPDTLKNCIESDTLLTQGVPEGTFKAYHCKNNLWDIVTPIMVGGRHVGNVYMGQYFYEDEIPDVELFRKQAHKYGFDEDEYLKALDQVPRFSKKTVERGMKFYSKLAGVISKLSYSASEQSRMLAEMKLQEIELVKAKDNAEKSEKYLNNIINNINDPIFVKDDQSRLLLVNEAYCKTFDLSRDIIIGKNLAEYVTAEEREKFLKNDKQVLTSGKENISEELLTVRGGQTKTISTRKSRFVDNNGEKHLIGIIRDITERIKAEEVLKTNFTLLKIAGETAKFGGWSFTIGDDHTVWSDEVAAIHDRPAGYLSSVEEGIKYYAPEYIETITRVFTNCIENGIPFDEELQIITAKGKRVWVRSTGEAVLGKEGNIIKVQGSFQDIHERKQTEEKITNQLNELRSWQNAMLNREERVLELKKEVNDLLAQTGKQVRYPSVATEDLE